MARETATPSPQKIAQAKRLYDAGAAPLGDVMKLLGMSASRFRSFREAQGWPLRPSPIKRRGERTTAPEAKKKRASSRSLVTRLEDVVEREFARAEEALAEDGPKSIEASARILASLVRSLAELKRLNRDAQSQPREDDDPGTDERSPDEPPRELAELRAELARRLERLRGEGEAG